LKVVGQLMLDNNHTVPDGNCAARGDDLLADDRVRGSSCDSALRGHDDGGVSARQQHVPSAGISWHDHEIRSVRLSRICVRYWSTTWSLR